MRVNCIGCPSNFLTFSPSYCALARANAPARRDGNAHSSLRFGMRPAHCPLKKLFWTGVKQYCPSSFILHTYRHRKLALRSFARGRATPFPALRVLKARSRIHFGWSATFAKRSSVTTAKAVEAPSFIFLRRRSSKKGWVGSEAEALD
jgi:hypothetical protein